MLLLIGGVLHAIRTLSCDPVEENVEPQPCPLCQRLVYVGDAVVIAIISRKGLYNDKLVHDELDNGVVTVVACGGHRCSAYGEPARGTYGGLRHGAPYIRYFAPK